jgi:hypothetical protein
MTMQSAPSGASVRLADIFQSDTLVVIREFFSKSPEMQRLAEILRIYAIVDANRVHEELRWRLGRRKNPQARSGFEEVLDAGVLVLIAPDFLRVEIEEDLPEIAESTGSTLSEAEREWRLLQAKLHFYPMTLRPPASPVADLKDLPYKQASDELCLPVYTDDEHLQKMGSPILRVYVDAARRHHLDTACRDYARSTSITLGFTMGSTYSATIGIEAFRAACHGTRKLFQSLLRLPPWAQVAIGGALSVILLHPKSRAKLVEAWQSISTTVQEAKGPLLDTISAVMQELVVAQSSVVRTRRDIENLLPPASKPKAIVLARRVCAVSGEPISISEIARRMRREGYVPRGNDPEGYLRRVMRESGQFAEVSRGAWGLRQ